MDDELQRLRRAVRDDPGDVAATIRLATAASNVGRFDEAWSVLAPRDEPESDRVLVALAREHAEHVLGWLGRIDYRTARLSIERLARAGGGGNPAIVTLACHLGRDQLLRRGAARQRPAVRSDEEPDTDRLLRDFSIPAVRTVVPPIALRVTEVWPSTLASYVQQGTSLPPRQLESGDAERAKQRLWTDEVRDLLARVPPREAVILLPWLIPLLRTRSDLLRAEVGRSVELVLEALSASFPPLSVKVARCLRDARD